MNVKRFNYYFLATITIAFIACKKNSGDNPNLPKQQFDIPVIDDRIEAFMSKYDVPGLSLAITKDEKLVYVKAYGKADMESGEDLTTESLFRIASISKSLTAIALMKLAEEGKLSLDDHVFGQGAILGTKYGQHPYSDRVLAITVRHLLNHTAGGWPNQAGDPMFTNPEMDAHELISWTLDNRPLLRLPGTAYAYSNFGYCVLGRIVEELTGKAYDQYVKDAILAPIGIKSMVNGGNTLADRKAGEVKYYGTSAGGTDPYAFNIARMDAHGGWIASAKDLVKLLVHVDGYGGKTDMLSTASILEMTTPPTLPNPSGYALGWSVRNGQWWHMGSLPGTVTELSRNGDNRINAAILTNTNAGPQYSEELDNLLWNAIIRKSDIQWQDIDQF